MVSSTEPRPVAAATFTSFSTFHPAASAWYVGTSKRRFIPVVSPMSSFIPPERYGYQSVRAGSHRWTWASTMRTGLVIGTPPRR